MKKISVICIMTLLFAVVLSFCTSNVAAAPNEPEAPTCHGWLDIVECRTDCHKITLQLYADPYSTVDQRYIKVNGVRYYTWYLEFNWENISQVEVQWYIHWTNGYSDWGTETILRKNYCATGITSIGIKTEVEGVPVSWPLELTYKGEITKFATEDGQFYLNFTDPIAGETFTVTNTLPDGVIGPVLEQRIFGLDEKDIEFLMYYENKIFLPTIRR